MCKKKKKNDDKKNKNCIRNLASVFKHRKIYIMGHYLIYNTQFVALETEKCQKKNNTRQCCKSMASRSCIRKQKCFNDILRVTGSNF